MEREERGRPEERNSRVTGKGSPGGTQILRDLIEPLDKPKKGGSEPKVASG